MNEHEENISERYFKKTEILNFLEIRVLVTNHLSATVDNVQTRILSIGEPFANSEERNRAELFWFLVEDIIELRLDEIYFENITVNKEIIKIINFNIHLELKNLEFDPETEIKYSDNFDREQLAEYYSYRYCYEAINFLYNLKNYFVPELEIEYKNKMSIFSIQEQEELLKTKDERLSKHRPSNNERLKSLKEFCPELTTKLLDLSKEEKGQIIHLITGVNKDDAYKKVFTADSRVLSDTSIRNDEIDFEDLKNKLNNT